MTFGHSPAFDTDTADTAAATAAAANCSAADAGTGCSDNARHRGRRRAVWRSNVHFCCSPVVVFDVDFSEL
jgi:hypothetical protein